MSVEGADAVRVRMRRHITLNPHVWNTYQTDDDHDDDETTTRSILASLSLSLSLSLSVSFSFHFCSLTDESTNQPR